MSIENYLPKVLISHSWRDKHEAMVIVEGLREMECAKIWIDFEHMNAGVDINAEIYKQIEESDCVILVWTVNSMKSDNVLNEIKWAKNLQKTIIPCIFTSGENIDNHYKKLERLLGSHKLGIEFLSYNQGLKELHSTLNIFLTDRLPTSTKEGFLNKNQTLKRIEGYNKYLVNYRNVKHQDADRSEWIIRIMKEIESLSKMGANKELINEFMTQLAALEMSDPDAYHLLKPKMDQYFSTIDRGFQYQVPLSVSEPFVNPTLEHLRINFLNMVQEEGNKSTSLNFLNQSLPQLSNDQITESIQNIINITADGINLLNQAYAHSFQAGLAHEFVPILNYISEYYYHVDDIRSDDLGPWGWVDDSYLCFSSLQQINEVYYSIYQQWLFQVDLNPYLQYLIECLDPSELHQLDNLLRHKFSSINWNSLLVRMAGVSMSNILFGNHQVNYNNTNRGGSWEDQMNERAARLGISMMF